MIYIFNAFDGNKGGNCCIHEVCGKSVHIGDVVLLKTMIDIGGENCFLYGYLIEAGLLSCKIGYVNKNIIGNHIFNKFSNVIVQVLECNDDEISSSVLEKYGGVIKTVVIGKTSSNNLYNNH